MASNFASLTVSINQRLIFRKISDRYLDGISDRYPDDICGIGERRSRNISYLTSFSSTSDVVLTPGVNETPHNSDYIGVSKISENSRDDDHS